MADCSMLSLHQLPTLNAALNGTSALLLVFGYRFIRRREITAHRTCMIAACAVSALFLISYLTYHYQVGTVRFPGSGWLRGLYLTVLLSHTLLAALVPPLAIMTLWRAVA